MERDSPGLHLPPVVANSPQSDCADCGAAVWIGPRIQQIRGEIRVICWDCAYSYSSVTCARYERPRERRDLGLRSG